MNQRLGNGGEWGCYRLAHTGLSANLWWPRVREEMQLQHRALLTVTVMSAARRWGDTGARLAGERERSEREAPAPGGCVHTHTGTCAYVHTCTQEATIAHFPRRQALPLILPLLSLDDFSALPQAPVQPVLLLADGVALLTKLSCNAQDQPSIITVASKIFCPLLAPPRALSPHCLSAVSALPPWSPYPPLCPSLCTCCSLCLENFPLSSIWPTPCVPAHSAFMSFSQSIR